MLTSVLEMSAMDPGVAEGIPRGFRTRPQRESPLESYSPSLDQNRHSSEPPVTLATIDRMSYESTVRPAVGDAVAWTQEWHSVFCGDI
jgi:hypothetical protein